MFIKLRYRKKISSNLMHISFHFFGCFFEIVHRDYQVLILFFIIRYQSKELPETDHWNNKTNNACWPKSSKQVTDSEHTAKSCYDTHNPHDYPFFNYVEIGLFFKNHSFPKTKRLDTGNKLPQDLIFNRPCEECERNTCWYACDYNPNKQIFIFHSGKHQI